MILLEIQNRILLETLQAKLDKSEKAEFLDITFADFDGVQLKLSSQPQDTNKVTVSIAWKCIPDLLANGLANDLKAIYGNLYQQTPESGYHVSLLIDFNNIPGDKAKLPEAVSLLKRHILASPLKKMFQQMESGSPPNKVTAIAYRDEEAIYLKPAQDNLIVIFNILFKDPGDQVLAKLFLQEFSTARRNDSTLNQAPAFSFSQKEAPGELKGVPGVKEGEGQGFVSFVLFKNHMSPKNADKTINLLITFRDYLHYHIKCSKAYMHTRMRNRVDNLLQVLNRARPADATKEKKTIGGKTFVRK